MKRRVSVLLALVLCITSVFCGGSTVYAGTMGAIPVIMTDTTRYFEYDVDGYISAGSTYLLGNPFDEEEDEQFFIMKGNVYTVIQALADPDIDGRQLLTLTVEVYSKKGTHIKTYSARNDEGVLNAISLVIPPQGPDRKIRITIQCANNTRIKSYGLYDWPKEVWEG